MEKKKYPLTILALERILTLSFEVAKHKKIAPPKILPASKNLPAPDEKITLPVYLGIFYQIKERLSDAMKAYETATGIDLDEVIKKGGFEIKGNLDNFFYLKQMWEIKGLTEKIEKLRPFYSFLKEDYLKRLKEKKERELDKLREDNQRLSQELSQLEESESEIFRTKMAIAFYILRLLAVFAVVVTMTIVSAIKAWEEAKRVSKFKTYAFCWKFWENLGWSTCFTVIGIPMGIFNILISQLMWILLRIQQDVEGRSASESSPAAN